MDFDLSDEQQVVADLASKLFEDLATPERVRDVERAGGFDHELWRELKAANLLGLCLPESCGGSGLGAVELALMAEAQGRSVAPVPLVPTIVAAMTVARHAPEHVATTVARAVIDDGTVLTSALASPGPNDGGRPTMEETPDGDALHVAGTAVSVPYGRHARWILLPAQRDGQTVVAVVDNHRAETGDDGRMDHPDPDRPSDTGRAGAAGMPGRASGTGLIRHTDLATTGNQPQTDIELDVVVGADWLLTGESLAELRQLTLAVNAAVLTGVVDAALAMTAEHVSQRHQFGKPLAAFQAVRQRAADAYITVQAMRDTALSAAWHLAAGLDATRETEVAAFWAADGGQAVAQACQHLHGGIGADVDYPVHRYFLWATQLGNELGSASAHLARVGHLLAAPAGAPAKGVS